MCKKFATILCGFLLAAACQDPVVPGDPPGPIDPLVDPVESVEGVEVESVIFTVDPYLLDDEESHTKTSLDGSTGFVWEATDTVGIYPNTGAQVYFAIASGAGTNSVRFDGGGWAFKTTSEYYSYFPFIGDIYLDRRHIPVSFSGQWQRGTNPFSLGPHDFMYTDACSAQNGGITFGYHHMCCIIRVRLNNLPLDTYTKLAITAPTNLFPSKGYFDLMAEDPDVPAIIPTEYTNQLVTDLKDFVISDNQEYIVYLMTAPPVPVNGIELTVSVLNSQKKEFQCKKTPSKDYVNPGSIYGLSCTAYTEVPQSMGMIMNNWESGVSLGGDAE